MTKETKMCEPAHSIIQYPNHDDDDNIPFGGQMSMDQRLKATLGQKVAALGKRIKNWFHFSKMGSGHTDSIQLSGRASLILPEHTRYEGLWWDRKFILDDIRYNGASVDAETAFDCAKLYHENVVMQNMSSFRRFLEASIRKSTYPNLYINRFVEGVLNPLGRDKFMNKLRRVFGKGTHTHTVFSIYSENFEPGIKVLMGFTRKRELYLPHWADDQKLWG